MAHLARNPANPPSDSKTKRGSNAGIWKPACHSYARKEDDMPKKNSRSAKTGRYVTEKYAKKHPATTVSETRKPKR